MNLRAKLSAVLFSMAMLVGIHQANACDGSYVSITGVTDNGNGTYTISMDICFALDVNWGATNDFDLTFSGGTFTSIVNNSTSPSTLNASYYWCTECNLNDNGTNGPNDDYWECIGGSTINTSASASTSTNTLTFSNDANGGNVDPWLPDDVIPTSTGGEVQSTSCITQNPDEICFSISVVVNGLPDNLHFEGAEDDAGTTASSGGCPEDHAIPQPVGCTPPSPAFSPGSGCEGSAIDFTNTGTQYSGNQNNNPYTYSWSFPGATPSSSTDENPTGVTWPSDGTYSVDFTMCSNNGTCCWTATQDVVISAAGTASAVATPETCNGDSDGSIDLTVSGGTAPFTYAWDNGAGSSEDPSGLATGTYNVTVTDAAGCVITAAATVSPGTMPTAAFTFSGTSCLSLNSFDFTNNSVDAISYTWDFGDGTGTSTATSPSYSYGSSGTFTVELTATDANGCIDVFTADVEVFEEPTLTVTPTDETCLGLEDGSIDLTVSGGNSPYTYSWTNGGAIDEDPSNLAPGDYTVTVTDANGCTAQITATVDPGLTIVADFDPVANACLDVNSYNLTNTGTSGVTYAWDFGDGSGTSTSENPSYTYGDAGTYTISQTVSSGTCSDTYSQQVTIYSEPVITANPTPISCNGAGNGIITTTVTGGTSGFTYDWGMSGSGNNSSSQTGLDAGTYAVEVTDANGCFDQTTAEITEPPLLVITPSNTDVSCNGGTDGTATVTASDGTPGYTYAWDAAAGSQTSATATGLAAGDYDVTVTDAGGCAEMTSVTITEPLALTLSVATNPSTCGSANGDATVTASEGTSPYTYAWDAAAASQTTATAGSLTAGSYDVTVTDAVGCIETITATVSDAGGPTITVDGTTPVYCAGGSDGTASITVTGGTDPLTYLWSAGTTTSDEDITGLTAGDATITVTDANGCSTTETVTITEPIAMTLTVTPTDPTCSGATNGDLTVDVADGTAPYTYLWSDAQTTQTATGLGVGAYTVTVTDANGCTETASGDLAEPAPLDLSAVPVEPLCNGGSDGTIDLTINVGVAPYTYAWSNSATVEDPANLTAGSYDVTVTDADGCIGTLTVEVTEPTAIVLTSSETPALCNGGTDGEATVFATEGTAPYTYLWDAAAGDQTTATATGLAAGDYTVIVTDDNGCTETITETVTEPVAMTLSTSSNTSTCGNANGDATVTVTDGTAPYTYLWDNAAADQTTATASILAAGSYDVTVTDANGCTATTTATVSDAGGPTVTIIATEDVSCFGGNDGTATADATGGTTPYTYAWPDGQSTAQATGLTAGDYIVTLTDGNGCVTTATATIAEPTELTLELTPTNVTCNGGNDGSISVTETGGTPGFTYSWDDANFQTVNPADGLIAGTYTVEVTDVNGCIATASADVTEPIAITVTTNTVPSNCGQADGSSSATAADGVEPYTYLWSDGQTNADASGLLAGGYTITVTDANGCTGTATADVQDTDGPVITEDGVVDASCFGDCDGEATISVTGGTTPYTYAWTDGQTIEDVTGLCAGDHTVNVTDANGCTATLTVTIGEPAVLVPNISSTTDVNCFGSANGSATADQSGGTSAYTYLWDAASGDQTGQTATGLAAGSYQVIITDANGCQDSVIATINEPDPLTVTLASNDALCNGSADGDATATPAGGTTPYTYLWSDGQTNATATGLAAGVYSVTVTDANSCTAGESILINEPTPVVVTEVSSTDATCSDSNDGTAEVIADGGTPGYTYSWNDPNNSTGVALINLADDVYTATATDANGCLGSVDVTITAPLPIDITLAPTNMSCFGIEDGSIDATISGGTAPYTVQWDDTPLSTTEDIGSLGAGTYTITVTDANDCQNTASVEITEPAEILISTTSTSSTCGADDGTATVSIAGGGVAPLTTLWDANANNQTTNTATALSANSYTVTVTDANGCFSETTADVVDLGSPSVTIIGSGDASCNGNCDGFANINVTDGTPGYTYSWTNGNTTTSPDDLCAGDHTITVTDASGCIATATVTINEPDPLVLAINNTVDATCFGSCDGSADILVNGGTEPYTYSWNDGAMQTTEDATGLCAGTYTLTVIDANSCSNTIEVTINEPVPVTLTMSQTPADCDQATGTATVTPDNGTAPFIYNWTSGDQTATSSSLLPGWYYVTATDANNCVANDSIEVMNTPGGVVSIVDPIDVSCPGATDGAATATMAGGSPDFSYVWSNGETTQTAVSLAVGTHQVVVTDAVGCQDSTTITINDAIPLATTMNTQDASCFDLCDGTAGVDVTGGVSPYSYLWNDPLAQSTQSINGLCGGSTYEVTITDANGCITSDQITISQPTEITATSTPAPSSCQQYNGSITVNATGGTEPFTYLWSDFDAQTNATATGLNAGTYTVTITDANDCSITETNEIIDENGPVSEITNSAMVSCFNANDGFATVTVTGGALPYNYIWLVSGDAGPTAANLGAGIHTVEITDATGCVTTSFIEITEPDVIQFNLTTTDPICFGDCNGTANIAVTGGTQPYNYLWDDASGSTVDSAYAMCEGNYTVLISDANGCDTSANFALVQPPFISATVTTTPASCAGMSDGTATVDVVNAVDPYTVSWDPTGQATNPAIDVPAGDYTVTITDANGCIGTATGTVTEPDGVVASVVNTSDVSCYDGNDGWAEISYEGGTAPFTVSWSHDVNETNATAQNLSLGDYVATVTDNNGCSNSVDISIAQPTELVATTTSIPVNCFEGNDGTAAASVSGGTGAYTYLWDDNGLQTTATATDLAAGTYTVTVTDENGCSTTSTVEVDEPSILDGTTSATPSNCMQNNGEACVSVIGGTPPYVYAWNDPMTQTTSCASNITGGSYLVDVTDANGCSFQLTANVNDIEAPTITVDNTTDLLCQDDMTGAISTTIAGGVDPYTITWDNSAETTEDLTGLDGGDYTITVIDAAGCTSSESVTLNEPISVNSAITASSNVTCFGLSNGTASVMANGGTPDYTYEWNSTPAQFNPDASGLPAGDYTVTVTDANGCSTTSDVSITQPEPLAINLDALEDVSCYDGSNGLIQTYGSGGTTPYSYTWDPNVGSGPNVVGLSAGNYCVSLTDANGCNVSDCWEIQQPAPLLATTTSNSSTCTLPNGNATITVNGGVEPYTYAWDANTGNQDTPIADDLMNGLYNVVVTDANGCFINSSIQVNDIPGPVAIIDSTQDVTCYGYNNGSIYSSPIGGTAPFTYSWSPTGGSNQAGSNLYAGTYQVTIVDANGCIDSTIASISQPDSLQAILDLVSPVICYGDSTQLFSTVSGGTGPYSYTWSYNGLDGMGPHWVGPTDDVNISVNIIDEQGCTAFDNIILEVLPPLEVSTIDTLEICLGDQATFCAEATAGNGGPYMYDWSNNVTDSCQTVSPQATTEYIIEASDGCSDNAYDTVVVVVHPNPVLLIIPDDPDGCMPHTVNFTINSQDAVDFEWDFDGDSITDDYTSTPDYTWYDPGMYDVMLTGISSEGCTTTITEQDLITVYDLPDAAFTMDPDTGTLVVNEVTFTDISTENIVEWDWDFGSLGTASDSTYMIAFEDTGSFPVWLTVTDNNGCVDSTMDVIIIEPEMSFYIPNAFSPNGDGSNDLFFPQGVGIDPSTECYHFIIFDRWGNRIWETRELSVGWDGRANGGANIAQIDVYVWVIEYCDFENNQYSEKGIVTLLR